MNNDDERFEKYLRGFQGPEPSPELARRAMGRARQRRVVAYAAGTALLAVAASLVVFISASQSQRTQEMPGPRAVAEYAGDEARLDRGSLILAYRIGGTEGLYAHLDRADKRFRPMPSETSNVLSKITENL